jgi:DNA primase
VLDDSKPKYMNSPETPVFSKGRELYGLFEARQALRDKGYALVVEGYMDVVALAQSGFANAVATLGTACTADHVQKLFRFTDSVVFSFDGDAAGRRAAARALEASLPHATDLRTVRFLFLPTEHDPDSYVRELGPEAFEQQVTQAVPLSRQLVEMAAEETDLGAAEGRARMLAQAKPLWMALPEGVLRQQVLQDLAQKAQMPADELRQSWGLGGEARRMPAPPWGSAPPVRRSKGALRVAARLPQDQVARILLQRCEWWGSLPSEVHDLLAQLPGWHAELFRWLDSWCVEHGHAEWPELREQLQTQSWGAEATALVDCAEVPIEPLQEDLLTAIEQTRRAENLKQHMQVLGRR